MTCIVNRSRVVVAAVLAAAMLVPPALATPVSYLAGIHKHTLLASTVPDNGDQNPYALVVAPVTAGRVKQGDVLVDDFNNGGNLQGTGASIMAYDPPTGQISNFATIPPNLPGCPGGVGLSTAMTMLRSGWVIVGSAPSRDGTTRTLGPGCLIILSAAGKVAGTIAGPDINDPWGNMAVIDHGDSATLFVSNAGFGIGAPGQKPQSKATVLRLKLEIPPAMPPEVTGRTVIADGLGAAADENVFLIGPTGLALDKAGTLYVSDAIKNRILAFPDAAGRNNAASPGREITRDGMLRRPLAMALAQNGHLLVVNGLDGNVVEIDPATGKQIAEKLIDGDEAQQPPGSGDLFGIAVNPDGKGFYYVEDDMNTLEQAQ